MPLQATSGAASYDGFGGGVAAVPNYIEDVFSTYLYTGNGSTQTITNGIDLSGKGGLVWCKGRSGSFGSGYHLLQDSARGFGNSTALSSNATDAQYSSSGIIQSVSTTGFVTGSSGLSNASSTDYASWTFRKQPKFFDVVTWTGNGVNDRAISHSLASAPGCILIKRTDNADSWYVYHRSLPSTYWLVLNSTAAQANTGFVWTTVTSTTFTVPSGTGFNASGGTYVAYLFAHDAGGFGLTGTDNVISCGSFTTDGSGNATVDLGYEPQWVLTKRTNSTGPWGLYDTMRGWSYSAQNYLLANDSGAEGVINATGFKPTATGFTTSSPFDASATYIYIAIRRGPMKVPTDATKVFNPVLGLTTAPAFVSSNFNSGIDSAINFYKPGYTGYPRWSSRLTGTGVIPTSSTAAESAVSVNTFDYMNGFYNLTGLGTDFGAWMFRRAPSFFDEVCYTGDGTADSRTFTHNLGVTPQLVIVKRRSSTSDWVVMFNTDHAVLLNSTNADTGYSNATGNYANGILIGTNATTLTQYSGASGNSACNASGSTYVAYLFATCAGVSKVGSYTGTGATQTISCGFTGGARFVLIKRTDSTGDWYVWDTARGMVSGTDPSLLLNSTAAEVNANSIYTTTGGFQIVSTAAGINASGGTYIFLAIA